MLNSESNLYVRIQESKNGLRPVPWHAGFCRQQAYRVLGYFHASTHGQPDFLLRTEHGHAMFVPLYHLRAVALIAHRYADCIPLAQLTIDEHLSLEELCMWGCSAYLMQHQALVSVEKI